MSVTFPRVHRVPCASFWSMPHKDAQRSLCNDDWMRVLVSVAIMTWRVGKQ